VKIVSKKVWAGKCASNSEVMYSWKDEMPSFSSSGGVGQWQKVMKSYAYMLQPSLAGLPVNLLVVSPNRPPLKLKSGFP